MEKALEILQHMEKLYAKDYNENYAAELPEIINRRQHIDKVISPKSFGPGRYHIGIFF